MRIYDPTRGGSIQLFEWPEYESDPHAIYSLTVRELVEDGFDVFGDPGWEAIDWPSDDKSSWLSETRKRVEMKLTRYFWNAEIEPRVPQRWRYELTTRALMIVPRYKREYEVLAEGTPLIASENSYGKNRRVFSDFPATQLDKSVSDYASSADDYQYENVRIGDVLDKMERIRNYNDIDAALIREFEPCFSQLLTTAIGGM